MSRIVRPFLIVLGIAAALGGTMLLMGSLHNGPSQAARLEQAKIEALGRQWEVRLETARGMFHDQLVRNDLLPVLALSGEWPEWRVRNKLQGMFSSWPRETGQLRAVALLTPAGTLHSVMGDTTDLALALNAAGRLDQSGMTFLPGQHNHPATIVIQYGPPPLNDGGQSGLAVALITAASLFGDDGSDLASWSLMASSNEIWLSSGTSGKNSEPMSEATWKLMVQEGSGTVKLSGLGSLCFTRVKVPGMMPLLLVSSVHGSRSAGTWGLVLLLFGVSGVIAASFFRRPVAPTVHAADNPPTPLETPATGDAGNLRQIFQAVEDPLFVVDTTGAILRANRSAQDWLKLQNGRPAVNLGIRLNDTEYALSDLLARALEDPVAASGSCRTECDGTRGSGVLKAVRLSRDGDGRGPVLMHFHAQPVGSDDRAFMPPVFVSASDDSGRREMSCPYPLLDVTPDGVVQDYNDAAHTACPRLESTPLLAEILPGMANLDIPELLGSESGATFESLFGAGMCEFTMVRDGDRVLLYGHQLSDSKRLEVEMKQAQENFYTLCGISPSAVLLVDPRDHAILEANAAAADLFGVTPPELRGQILDTLSAEPWEMGSGDNTFWAASAGGLITQCWLRFELIKIEGAPTLLVMLEVIPDAYHSTPDPMDYAAPESEPVVEHAAQEVAPPPLPVGPAMLISLNPTVREVARRLLAKTGHPTEVFTNLDDATVWLITHDMRPELAAIDLTDFDDAETWIQEMRSRCGSVPCMAFADDAGYEMPNGGLNEILSKPFDLDSMTGALLALQLSAELCETIEQQYDDDSLSY